MPKRDDDLLISDMIECCRKILEYVKEMDFEKFIADEKTADAVIRNFEILGEAAKYISSETKSNSPLIEWRKMSDFRNILIHDYLGSIMK
ncbi:MAG TPA: HepT-like ribonuclease domain-containing protein [Chitinophagaceae bacterium]|nr:HepT-like ribonuclease domain-containing protein [Chitinophagaceae bacterium]